MCYLFFCFFIFFVLSYFLSSFCIFVSFLLSLFSLLFLFTPPFLPVFLFLPFFLYYSITFFFIPLLLVPPFFSFFLLYSHIYLFIPPFLCYLSFFFLLSFFVKFLLSSFILPFLLIYSFCFSFPSFLSTFIYLHSAVSSYLSLFRPLFLSFFLTIYLTCLAPESPCQGRASPASWRPRSRRVALFNVSRRNKTFKCHLSILRSSSIYNFSLNICLSKSVSPFYPPVREWESSDGVWNPSATSSLFHSACQAKVLLPFQMSIIIYHYLLLFKTCHSKEWSQILFFHHHSSVYQNVSPPFSFLYLPNTNFFIFTCFSSVI